MSFTTQSFLFVFFPFTIATYTLAAWWDYRIVSKGANQLFQFKDLCFVGISLTFYACGGIRYVVLLFMLICIVYVAARIEQFLKNKDWVIPVWKKTGKDIAVAHVIFWTSVACGIAVTLCLLVLFCIKYSGFAVRVWNSLTGSGIPEPTILAPLGISFVVFSAISYLSDVKRGAEPGTFLDCALYLSFFPKVISGPIVRWSDFAPQIRGRKTTIDDVVAGMNRIMIGFAKKLILADSFGQCIASIRAASGCDIISAWGCVLLYTLQIYYDFSGYSDIAIGLSCLFGFSFKENFDFPYRSTSITEFWRRWHISLGAWFREYVYIPLGGSRIGKRRTLINLAIVFILTGIWHGAGWNYILWGAINGFFVILERIVKDCDWYKRIPRIIKWAGTMLVVMLFWQLFYWNSARGAVRWLSVCLCITRFDRIPYTWQYYFSARIIVFMIIAIVGAILPGDLKVREKCRSFRTTPAGFALTEGMLLGLMVLSILFMVNSTYSPFIYFQY